MKHLGWVAMGALAVASAIVVGSRQAPGAAEVRSALDSPIYFMADTLGGSIRVRDIANLADARSWVQISATNDSAVLITVMQMRSSRATAGAVQLREWVRGATAWADSGLSARYTLRAPTNNPEDLEFLELELSRDWVVVTARDVTGWLRLVRRETLKSFLATLQTAADSSLAMSK